MSTDTTFDYKRPGAILGMGNPLLDVCANVEKSMLDKYGMEPGGALIAEEKHQGLAAELEANYEVTYVAGGATQNSIRAAQWMLGSEAKLRFFGSVGADAHADALRAAAEKDGLETNYHVADEITGTCSVLITDHERSMAANLKAANLYDEKHLIDNWKQVEEAQLMYSAGFFLTVSPPSAMRMAKHCAETNKPYCLNISAPFLVQFFWEPMSALLPYADYIFANEVEAATLGSERGFGSTLEEIALAVAQLPKVNEKRSRTVIFTQGAKQVVVCRDGKVSTYDTPVVPKEELVDLNGAGDCFVGGFLAAMVRGCSFEDCLKAGHFCAGYCIRHTGIQFNHPNTYQF